MEVLIFLSFYNTNELEIKLKLTAANGKRREFSPQKKTSKNRIALYGELQINFVN